MIGHPTTRASAGRRPHLVAALAAVTALSLVTACTGDDAATDAADSSAPTTPDSVVLTSDGRLRVRPVVTLLPIDGMPLNPFGDDDPAEPIVSPNTDSTVAYDLGPSVADEDDVTEASAAAGAAGEWTVSVTFTPRATDRIRSLAAACLAVEPSCERGQIAVTVDGFVLTALPVTDTDLGPTLALSGGLNEEQATVIASSLDD